MAVYIGQNKLGVVKELLAKGASLWSRSEGGATVLLTAVEQSDADPAVVQFILGEICQRSCAAHPASAEINRPIKADGWKRKLVQALCKALYHCGASGNPLVVAIARDVGRTPLHCAALNGDREVFELLLEAGCDLTRRSDLGWTALDEARERGHDFVY